MSSLGLAHREASGDHLARGVTLGSVRPASDSSARAWPIDSAPDTRSARTSSGSLSSRMKLATDAAVLADRCRDLLLRQAELVGQPPVRQCFIDGVQVFALNVLDERQLEQLLVGAVGNVADDDRHLVQSGALSRAPSALAGNDAIRRSRFAAPGSAG